MKYLDVETNENFIWKQQIWNLAINLNRENANKSKDIDRKSLREKCPETFESHFALFFSCWGKKIQIQLKNVLFWSRDPRAYTLF